jgi:hypothetical protein
MALASAYEVDRAQVAEHAVNTSLYARRRLAALRNPAALARPALTIHGEGVRRLRRLTHAADGPATCTRSTSGAKCDKVEVNPEQKEVGSVGEHKLKEQPTEWERKRDRIKTLWVVAVLLFWGTCGIQLVVYLLKEKLDFILLSIILGMLVLGVVLKVRLQLHLRKGPPGE